MHCAFVETSLPATPPDQLPLHLEQKAATATSVIMLLILVPVALALLLPFLMLAQALAADASVRAAVAENPRAATQLVLGLAFWFVLFAWPMKRLIDQLARSRSVHIDGGRVTVTDRTILSTKNWSEPLGAFGGISHHVRSSLSGVRHELILVHPDPSKSVLVALASRIGEAEIERVRALFRPATSPSLELYRRLQEAFGSSESAPMPALQSQAA